MEQRFKFKPRERQFVVHLHGIQTTTRVARNNEEVNTCLFIKTKQQQKICNDEKTLRKTDMLH